MAYFNHAFQKMFVGTNGFQTAPGASTTSLSLGEYTLVTGFLNLGAFKSGFLIGCIFSYYNLQNFFQL